MTNKEIFSLAMSEIDEELIAEAALPYKKNFSAIKKGLLTAAVLAIVTTSAIGIRTLIDPFGAKDDEYSNNMSGGSGGMESAPNDGITDKPDSPPTIGGEGEDEENENENNEEKAE